MMMMMFGVGGVVMIDDVRRVSWESLCAPALLLQIVRADVVLALDVVQFVLLLVHVHPFEGLVRLVVENDQIPIAHIEAGQMIAGVLRIEDVLVDNEGGAPGFGRVSTANREGTH